MRILFDQGTPLPLRKFLSEHEVSTAYKAGFSRLRNGDLLDVADGAFDLMITTDQSIRHEQNLSKRKIAILVLPTTNWREIERHAAEIVRAVDSMRAGEYRELTW